MLFFCLEISIASPEPPGYSPHSAAAVVVAGGNVCIYAGRGDVGMAGSIEYPPRQRLGDLFAVVNLCEPCSQYLIHKALQGFVAPFEVNPRPKGLFS